jgi:hypothetical protein
LDFFSEEDELPPADLLVDLSEVDFSELDFSLDAFSLLDEEGLLSAAADFL